MDKESKESKKDKKHSSSSKEHSHHSHSSSKKKHKRTSPDSNEEDESNITNSSSSNNPEKSSRKKRHIEVESKPESKGEEKSELSIEETNKLRAELGLKPLQIDKPSDKPTVSVEGNQIYHDKDFDQTFEHVPAKNVVAQKQEALLREKLNEQKDKHKLQDKYLAVKKLGEDDSVDNAENWVEKLKQKQLEREQAMKKAKSLEEMDEQFAVTDIVSNEFNSKAKKPKTIKYTSNDLTGLKVEHAQDTFKEGQSMILTIKDKYVLDEENDDVLVNVNIIDDEKAKENNENKKKKSTYKAYDEFDESGNFKEKSILDKYDEEIDGEQRKSFKLGKGGVYDNEMDRFIERQNDEFRSKAIKLDTIEMQLAKDYLTKDEAEEKFKKPKKMRKKIRKAVKADDLIPLEEDENKTESKLENYGSRKSTKIIVDPKQEMSAEVSRRIDEYKANAVESVEKKVSIKDIDFNFKKEPGEDEEEDEIEEGEEIENVELSSTSDLQFTNDDAFDELHNVLNKIRKKTVSTKLQEMTERIVSQRVKIEEEETNEQKKVGLVIEKDKMDVDIEDDDQLRSITLDTMSEFCRNLGDIPTLGRAGNRKIDEKETKDYENDIKLAAQQQIQKKKDKNAEEEEEDDEDREMKEDSSENEEEKNVSKTSVDDDRPILDEEPMVDRGLASALRLALNKGYLIQEKTKQNARLKESIAAENFTIEEKNYYDIDDKYTRGNRDRYGGPTYDFKEKEGYKPEVKLDYIDETGHRMNEKEAFRYLSHRFHGKGSGKKKTEKRFLKHKEQDTMDKMSSIDTPLNTVALLIEKQKRLQQPFIVLSAPKGGKGDHITLNKP